MELQHTADQLPTVFEAFKEMEHKMEQIKASRADEQLRVSTPTEREFNPTQVPVQKPKLRTLQRARMGKEEADRPSNKVQSMSLAPLVSSVCSS